MAPSSKPTQDFVPIEEIRDGFAILKDGSMRAIIMSSSLNFALKSQEEQTSILYQFQAFLNSLDFSIQIFIESRRLDIRPYIALMESRYKEQTNDLLKIQTLEYIDFVKSFTESTSIMTKSFFIVVPYTPAFLQGSSNSVMNKIPISIPGFNREQKMPEKAKVEQFEENRAQLEQRIAVVEQGLIRCGVRVVRLGSEEIIELFYKMFNPGDTEKPIAVK